MAMTKLQRTLSVFTLTMINIATIGSVKNWPLTAEYGLASVFFLIVAAFIFFMPISFVSAELATGWPKRGGVFVWVKEAFGHRTGFLAVWLLWMQNIVWYPTILSFIVATSAFIFAPELAQNPSYTLVTVLVTFWAITLVNFFGMKASGWISTIGILFGMFIPAAAIIALGFAWFGTGRPLEFSFTWNEFIPSFRLTDLVFFAGIMISLAGMEMPAVHARDVKHPQKNYPKAILYSVILILGLSIPGVLAIAAVIPQDQISLLSGPIQAFSIFVNAYGLGNMIPIMAALIAIGALASVSTWTVGPTKGLLAAAESGDLPPLFRSVNKKGMPIALLIGQAIVVSVLSLLFVLMPSLNAAYWVLMVMVGQLYLILYLLMFAAAIKLRYKRPHTERSFKVPGGNLGMWLMAGLGLASTLFALFLGFLPPSQLDITNQLQYVGFIIGGVIVACIGPNIILAFKRPHWDKPLSHEGQEED